MQLSSVLSELKDLDPFLMFQEHFTQAEDVLRDLAHSKRFLERLTGDDEFLHSVLNNELSLKDAGKLCGCAIDVSTLRPVFDPSFTKYRERATLEQWRLTYLWDQHLGKSGRIRNALLLRGGSGGKNPKFDAWRARNINRTALQLGIASAGIIHPPVCFELSSGCSVGCWFCGISAEKFKGHATLADGGAEGWRETLRAVQSIVGDGMQCGFCYWATDPLDNPEYIGFLEIFEEVTGALPQTTTAIPLRDIALTRDVLRRWETRRTTPNRFSIMTKRALIQVHETFTPEELLGVELVIQISSHGGTAKFRAGKSFGESSSGERAAKGKSLDGTIACVSGFLINIVERKVKLISPVMPSETYPNGYIVFDEAAYADPADLKKIMDRFVDRHMNDSLVGTQPVSITAGGSYDKDAAGSRIRFTDFCVENDYIRVVGDYLQSGEMDPLSIVKEASRAGMPPMRTVVALESLWKEGILHQENG